MNWEVSDSRNGEHTLILNNFSIYSKYNPKKDAYQWIDNEIDNSKENFLLIGLGLGYHLERLIQSVKDKMIIVYYFEEDEIRIFEQFNKIDIGRNVHIVNSLNEYTIDDTFQILIPHVWIKALGRTHPLVPFLEDIKINQLTYRKSATIMRENFLENIELKNFPPYPSFRHKKACLVGSGPTLNDTIEWLKDTTNQIDIFVVGSALKALLAKNIIPSAVVISDAKPSIIKQLKNVDCNVPLLYLSTANAQAVREYSGSKYIVFQKGYRLSENVATSNAFPLIETGGSVVTTTISLLELLGFETIFLFGVDLGFNSNQTHAMESTSGRVVSDSENLEEIISNSGKKIFTTPNLKTYLRWIEAKLSRSSINVYNTSYYGAKIQKVPYINKQQFHKFIHE